MAVQDVLDLVNELPARGSLGGGAALVFRDVEGAPLTHTFKRRQTNSTDIQVLPLESNNPNATEYALKNPLGHTI